MNDHYRCGNSVNSVAVIRTRTGHHLVIYYNIDFLLCQYAVIVTRKK